MNLIKTDLINALKAGIRMDGRKLLDSRKLDVEVGGVKTAEGFARVKLGETEVLAGVKLSVGTPFSDTPDEGVISVSCDLSPLASPEFESGPPSVQAIELARIVDRGIREAKTVDLKQLCIEPKEKVWMINVDIAPINDSGNLIDAAGIAAVLALKNTVFPAYENDVVDYKHHTDKKLPTSKIPIPVTVCKFDKFFVVDPAENEEKFIDARLTAAVTEDNIITAIQKGGDSAITVDEAKEMMSLIIKKSQEIRKKIEKYLK